METVHRLLLAQPQQLSHLRGKLIRMETLRIAQKLEYMTLYKLRMKTNDYSNQKPTNFRRVLKAPRN